jgi:hypothetical protein
MCLLKSTNWVFISQKTTFFIVTAVQTPNLTLRLDISMRPNRVGVPLHSPEGGQWISGQGPGKDCRGNISNNKKKNINNAV